MEVNKELNEEQQIKEIRTYLMLAAKKTDEVSRTAKPFRRSKFLNMLYKEIKQLDIEVLVFLGHDPKALDYPELVSIPSINILKAMIRDNELTVEV